MQLLSTLFPLTARRIGEGLICGRERVITTKNGTAHWVQGPGFAMGVGVYDGKNAVVVAKSAALTNRKSVAPPPTAGAAAAAAATRSETGTKADAPKTRAAAAARDNESV